MAVRNKNAYRAFLIISFVAINVLVIFGIGAVFSYLNTGADRTTMLHLESEVHEVYLPKVVWTDTVGEGRPMEKQTLSEIERDYKRAWYVKNLAYNSNNTYGLNDYYTDSALVKFERFIELNKAKNITLNITTLNHRPDLEFYSADGTMVVFKDENVNLYKETLLNDTIVFASRDTTSYRVIMLLEDGFWRIRHIKQLDIPTESVKQINHKKSNINIDEVKGVNYYPQKHPWDMYGEYFDSTVVATDFKTIKDMGLNTVRLFVPYEAFGKNFVDSEKLSQVESTLDIAQNNSLKAIVTLFDFYGNYDITDWTLTHRHAETVVNTLKNHPALFAWDIKNEPDLDFATRGKKRVTSWLKEMIIQVKTWDQENIITIGWSSTEGAENLVDEVDLVSFHYYLKPSNFKSALNHLKSTLPKNKPLMLQEYGTSSYVGLWSLFIGKEDKQEVYFKEMQNSINEEGLPFIFWTLYDFEEIPSSVVGHLPWRKTPQKYFGCIDKDGNKKPSFQRLSY
ncbi:glycoside hydrolase family 2 TIM barrel-domain containing protein [Maribacter sp. CXY002]|uniref:glycoside hydrolase family 2 TIM barrel-domain containing protein n=1 Tax=Maribacter luteocoastalis TaxID=3407671 RepID=UPI003B6758C3